MSRSSHSLGRVMFFTFIGLILGGILGESLGLLFGQIGEWTHAGSDNLIRNFFVEAFQLGFGFDESTPLVIDLYMIKFSLGIAFKFNIVSVIGLVGSLYIMKWSGDR